MESGRMCFCLVKERKEHEHGTVSEVYSSIPCRALIDQQKLNDSWRAEYGSMNREQGRRMNWLINGSGSQWKTKKLWWWKLQPQTVTMLWCFTGVAFSDVKANSSGLLSLLTRFLLFSTFQESREVKFRTKTKSLCRPITALRRVNNNKIQLTFSSILLMEYSFARTAKEILPEALGLSRTNINFVSLPRTSTAVGSSHNFSERNPEWSIFIHHVDYLNLSTVGVGYPTRCNWTEYFSLPYFASSPFLVFLWKQTVVNEMRSKQQHTSTINLDSGSSKKSSQLFFPTI